MPCLAGEERGTRRPCALSAPASRRHTPVARGPAAPGDLPGAGPRRVSGRRPDARLRGAGVGRYLECGCLPPGFARARCSGCGHDFLIAFSCKGRGVCPSGNARRMVETAAHRVDQVIPHLPVRQFVLSLPKRLRYFLQHDPGASTAPCLFSCALWNLIYASAVPVPVLRLKSARWPSSASLWLRSQRTHSLPLRGDRWRVRDDRGCERHALSRSHGTDQCRFRGGPGYASVSFEPSSSAASSTETRAEK